MSNFTKINPEELLEGSTLINGNRIIEALEIAADIDRILLKANTIIKNSERCKEISDRICDTEVYLCFLRLQRFNRVG